MAEKNFNNIRIINKHDTEANWLKATGFTPKQGELIVYDIDDNYSYERIKIGDGVQNVNALPFYAGSWKDLVDKPFGSEGPTIVEWDGNTTGLVVSSDGSAYKVTDLKPNSTDVIGGKLTFSNGSVVEITSDIIEGQGYIISIYYGSVLINTTNGSAGDYSLSVTLPEPGIYFQKNTYNQLVSFSYGNEIVYCLDEKYIPDTIARVSDIEDAISKIPTPDVSGQIETHNTSEIAHNDIRATISDVSTLVGDTSVSDQISTAISKIPIADNYKNGLMTSTDKKKLDTIESNAQKNVQSDWALNDMTSMSFVQNRPFYEGPISITWDGVTKGHASHMYDSSNYLVKITDTIFTDEELQTAKFVISENGTTTEVVVADVWENRATTSALTGIIYNNKPCVYVVRSSGTFVGPGTYFLYNYSSKIYIKSFTVGSEADVKQIDEKYIPDSIARASEIYELNALVGDISVSDQISAALSEFESGMSLQSIAIALPDSDSWMSVAYGNGKFVAVSSESNVAAYSIDGMNWTATTMPRSGAWHSVIYANGKFVAVCAQYGLSQAAYSTDGINWVMSNLSLSNGASSYESYSFVAYGEGRFVIVSNSNGYAAYSADGVTWTNCTTPPTIACKAVTYGDGVFVAIPTNGSTASYSRDGIVWHSSTVPFATYHNLAYGNGKFVATYLNSNTSVLCAIYSTDGINWTSVNIGSSTSYYSGICYGNNKFVAVATYGNSVIYSEDGINWSFTNMVEGNNWYSVCYSGDKFVAIAWGGKVAHSSDGITWSDQRQFISQDSVDVTDNVAALTQRRDVYTQAQVDALIAAVREACMPKVTTVTLFTDEWTYSGGEYYYDVKLSCLTSNSQVNLQTDATSLAILQDDGTALVPVTYSSFVRIWTVGGSPREDLTVQITVQEVMEV